MDSQCGKEGREMQVLVNGCSIELEIERRGMYRFLHFTKRDVDEGEIAEALKSMESPMRLLAAEELGFDFFSRPFPFTVVVLTEQGAICILRHPEFEPQTPQFCFKRWTTQCRFPVALIKKE